MAPDLLSYVYLSNGKMLNEEIVRAGYANLITAPSKCEISGEVFEGLSGGKG